MALLPAIVILHVRIQSSESAFGEEGSGFCQGDTCRGGSISIDRDAASQSAQKVVLRGRCTSELTISLGDGGYMQYSDCREDPKSRRRGNDLSVRGSLRTVEHCCGHVGAVREARDLNVVHALKQEVLVMFSTQSYPCIKSLTICHDVM